MTEKFALQQCRRQRRAVHRNKRRPRPRTCLVDGLRNQLLARTGLTFDQDRGLRRRYELHAFDYLAQPLRVAHNALEAELIVEALVELLHFDLQGLGLERAPNQNLQFLEVNRLGEEIESAALHRLDGRFNIAVRRHHDDDRPARQRQRLVNDL